MHGEAAALEHGGCTVVLIDGLTWLQQYYLLRLETKLALLHSSRFFTHLLRLPVPYFVQRYAGEIGSRVAINDQVANVIAGQARDHGRHRHPASSSSTSCSCCATTSSLTLVVAAIAALNVVVVKLVARVRTDAARRVLQDKGKLMGTAMGGLQMIETLKATGGEDGVLRALGRLPGQVAPRRAGRSARLQHTTGVGPRDRRPRSP